MSVGQTREARRAHQIVHNGAWWARNRQPCEQCGNDKDVQAHHDDYAKPLEVRWLCRSHHIRHHNLLKSRTRKGRG